MKPDSGQVCGAGVGVVCVSGVSRPTWVVQSGSSSIPQSGAEKAVKTCSDLNTVGGLWRSSANRITEEVKGRASWERVGRRLHSPTLKHEGNLRITGLRITELLVGYFRGEKNQRINRDSEDVLIYRSRRTVNVASEHLRASSAEEERQASTNTVVSKLWNDIVTWSAGAQKHFSHKLTLRKTFVKPSSGASQWDMTCLTFRIWSIQSSNTWKVQKRHTIKLFFIQVRWELNSLEVSNVHTTQENSVIYSWKVQHFGFMHDSAALTGRCLRHRYQIIMYGPCIESTSLCSPEGRTTFFQKIFPCVVFGWWCWGPVRRVTSLCQCWVWFWFWYWSRTVYRWSLITASDLDDFI